MSSFLRQGRYYSSPASPGDMMRRLDLTNLLDEDLQQFSSLFSRFGRALAALPRQELPARFARSVLVLVDGELERRQAEGSPVGATWYWDDSAVSGLTLPQLDLLAEKMGTAPECLAREGRAAPAVFVLEIVGALEQERRSRL